MTRTIFLFLCAAACLACPARSQSTAAPIATEPAFAAFLRVAAFTGQSSRELALRLPVPHNGDGGEATIALTAAHLLSVRFGGPTRSRTDSASIVRSVALMERMADTVALRSGVAAVLRELETKHGAPDRCGMPFGPPAYLFAPQEVERVWTRGIAQQQTRLSWWVTKDGQYGLTVTVSATPEARQEWIACSAAMP